MIKNLKDDLEIWPGMNRGSAKGNLNTGKPTISRDRVPPPPPPKPAKKELSDKS